MAINHNEEILKRCKVIMAEENLNQRELCRKTGIDEGTFSVFIRGKANLGMLNYNRLSTFLNAYGPNVAMETAIEDEEVIEEETIELEETPRDTYEDLSLEEIDDLEHRLMDIKRKKLQQKLDEIENEIMKLYELQETYEKLLKEL